MARVSHQKRTELHGKFAGFESSQIGEIIYLLIYVCSKNSAPEKYLNLFEEHEARLSPFLRNEKYYLLCYRPYT